MSQQTFDPMEKTKNAIEHIRKQISMIEIEIATAQSTGQESKNQIEEHYILLEELDKLDTIYTTWVVSQGVDENDELLAMQTEFNNEVHPGEIQVSKKPSWLTDINSHMPKAIQKACNEPSWIVNTTCKKICTKCYFQWDIVATSNICSLCNGNLITV